MRADTAAKEPAAGSWAVDGSMVPPVRHGGDRNEARRLFPDAPTPWVDLSTGISPFSYPVPPIPDDSWARLPEADGLDALCRAAATAYGADPDQIVAGSGTQPLMAAILSLVSPGRATILGPTYAEHERLCLQAGHAVQHVNVLDQVTDDAHLVIVVNPNNPMGAPTERRNLLALADELERRGGLLIVDEAFMDSLGPRAMSVCGDVGSLPIVALRSVGKFYGLAGLRLSFAVAARPVAEKLAAALGPWPVSGPAIAIGRAALADKSWQTEQRIRLSEAAVRLDRYLESAGFWPAGASPLFRTLRGEGVPDLFERLGRAGIWTRRFAFDLHLLRIGLPGNEADWQRLGAALAGDRD